MIKDEAELPAIAAQLAVALSGGTIVFLQGALGVGKTTFVRYYLRALGFFGKVKSPTYTIIEPYVVADINIFHFDLYRLNDPNELLQIGVAEYFTEQSICFIEWPEKGFPHLPAPDLDCYIEFADSARCMQIKARSALGEAIVEVLVE